MHADTVIPYGLTSDGKLIATFAIDHAYWTETSADAVSRRGGLNNLGQHREAWVLGTLSERCRAKLEEAEFDVIDNIAALME